MKSFKDINLLPDILEALTDEGYQNPTPVQAQAIPQLLKGRDMLACAQTGTGKTAAFALPVLQRIGESELPHGKPAIRALILTPTRELAAQIDDSLARYGRHLEISHAVIFGGVSERPQITALKRGVEILVATPGRLLDLLGRGFVDLSKVDFFVLDEADRMLDMGFIVDVRKVLKKLPEKRQNLLFSATLPRSIQELAQSFLKNPVTVTVAPEKPTAERIEQSVMFVERDDKTRLLTGLLREDEVEHAIVFTRTKRGADRLARKLSKSKINALAIHGNKSQNARTRALNGFRSGEVKVLVATDIASRGIDVDTITHVFNYNLPIEAESYVHRIGRTARAGREGVAVSLCDPGETDLLLTIERLLGKPIKQDHDHDMHCADAVPFSAAHKLARSQQKKSKSRSSRGRHRGPARARHGRPGKPRHNNRARRRSGSRAKAQSSQ